MLAVLEIAILLVVAVAMALALAHALEWPGKKRLSRDEYLAMQAIYYPGFTVGGFAEPVGIVLLIVLAALTPAGTVAFWLTLGAALALAAMHAAYWLLTHPVNNFWLKDVTLKGASKGFFAIGSGAADGTPDWTALRDRWEMSHAVRAVFGVLALGLAAAATALRD
jgi:hypothetical protein